MSLSIGMMQGRLSPSPDGRIHCFPAELWKTEFPEGARVGFDCIEWVYETTNLDRNPFRSEEGLADIREAVEKSGVEVSTICANYFMDHKLYGESEKSLHENISALAGLFRRAGQLGCKGVVLPIIEHASLNSERDREELKAGLYRAFEESDDSKVLALLETDLSPEENLELLRWLDHPRARLAFDMGNSAAVGFDPREEIEMLGDFIAHVHVKDRIRNGGNVALGTGAVDFDAVFQALARIGYDGDFVLETARLDDEIEAARRHLDFIRPFVERIGVAGEREGDAL